MKLFVRNLSYSATSDDLRKAFEKLGYAVSEAKVIASGEDGRSRGFGFVTVDGDDAVAASDGMEHMGRTLQVMVAKDKEPRSSGRGRMAKSCRAYDRPCPGCCAGGICDGPGRNSNDAHEDDDGYDEDEP